jgi:hypothetical protein
MSPLLLLLRRHAARLFALAAIGALAFAVKPPALAPQARAALSGRYSFRPMELEAPAGGTPKTVRAVSPSLQRISAWISSVGAAIALADLDGDGLPNDVCWVDPRTDRVIVAPVPGTGARYPAFALSPGALPYDDTMAPMGCLPSDMNEDGWTDLLVYYWGRPPIAFLRLPPRVPGEPPSAAAYRPVELVPGGERWFTGAATFADVDGDGHLDLVIGNYFADGARILDRNATAREEMQDSMSRAFNGGRARILRWRSAQRGPLPDVSYEQVLLDPAFGSGWTLAIGAADFDGDLLPELYFANDFGPDRLLHNRSRPGHIELVPLVGRKGLTTPNSKIVGRDSFKGMGVDFADVDGDGLLDIFVSNIAAEYALEESHFLFVNTGEVGKMKDGIAPFVDQAERFGLSRSTWAWAARLDDFDNDGAVELVQATGFVRGSVDRWPELHELAMGNDELLRDPRSWPRFQSGDDLSGHPHIAFFARDGSGRFHDIGAEVGLGAEHISRGIATADVDGDGRLDFAVANQWESSFFYRNESPSAGAFLGLRLVLPLIAGESARPQVKAGRPPLGGLARPAVGAGAVVHLPDGRVLVRQIDGGNGHASARSPELHFGLGATAASQDLRVDLSWRDPGGRVWRDSVELKPGWHTVVLGWPQAEGRR